MTKIKGSWEVPEFSHLKTTGELIIDDKLSLHMFAEGEFFTMQNFFNAVYGLRTHEGEVTLFDVLNRGNSMNANGIVEFDFEPYDVLLGIKLQTKDDKRFNAVSFELDNTNEWLDLTVHGTENYNQEQQRITFNIEPENNTLQIDLDDFTLKIIKGFTTRGNLPYHDEFNIKVYSKINFTYKENVSFTRILGDIRTFQRFFTFLVNHPQYPQNIQLERSDLKANVAPGNCVKYYSKEFLNKSRPNRFKHMLLKYSNLNDNLKDLYLNWIKLEKTNKDLISLFLFDLSRISIVLDDQFLNLVSLLDNYLKENIKIKSSISKSHFRAARSAFLEYLSENGATESELEDIKIAIGDSLKPTFRKRLIEFLESNKDMKDHFILSFFSRNDSDEKRKRGFIDLCLEFRNNRAHGTITKSNPDIYEIINRLYFIDSYIILCLLGFTKDEAYNVLLNHQKHGHLYFE